MLYLTHDKPHLRAQ